MKIDHHKLSPVFSAYMILTNMSLSLRHHLCCIFSSNDICTHQVQAETGSGDYTHERQIGLQSSFYSVQYDYRLMSVCTK